MRSFFPEYKIADASMTAYNYYRGQAQKYWLSNGKYSQAMIALALNRTKDDVTPKAITRSLKENAIIKEEMGMYWKEWTTGGYYWNQAPIESQAMMIEAFTDIDKNTSTVDDLKTWLLKQKQTQNWKTTKATAATILAALGMRPNPFRQLIQFVRCYRNLLPEALFEKAAATRAEGMAATRTPRIRSAIRGWGHSIDWRAMPKIAT